MNILGLNVFHADTSACLIKDGKLISAVEEERFTRIKHFTGFPLNSINFCLKENNLNLDQIDYISVNHNKSYNFKHRLLFGLKKIHKINALNRINSLFSKSDINSYFLKNFNYDISKKIQFVPHHLSHIASTYYQSSVDNALGFSFDGSGDFSTIEVFDLSPKKIKILEKTLYPDSIGIYYQAITQFLGFKNYGDEYKVMGLASYGKPIYKDRIKKIIYLDKNKLKLNLKYFEHQHKAINYDFESGIPYFEDLFSNKMKYLFGNPREINEPITQFHKDLAASMQSVMEDIVIEKLDKYNASKKYKNLCISGGCAFNSVLNGKLIQKTNFENIYSSQNVGDAGGAVGAALYTAFENKVEIARSSSLYLGPKYDDEDINEVIEKNLKYGKNYERIFFDNFEKLCDFVSKFLAEKKIVGWYQDAMEWGPRSLGNRSILADPRHKDIRDLINLKIKLREEFRPFAPAVLLEKTNHYFNLSKNSDYMGFVFDAKDKAKKEIPAVVHTDNTSRVQTVSKKTNKKFYSLIESFEKLTSVPVVLNTSLNVNEPICEKPNDALEVFNKTSMDVLVMQNWVLIKNDVKRFKL